MRRYTDPEVRQRWREYMRGYRERQRPRPAMSRTVVALHPDAVTASPISTALDQLEQAHAERPEVLYVDVRLQLALARHLVAVVGSITSRPTRPSPSATPSESYAWSRPVAPTRDRVRPPALITGRIERRSQQIGASCSIPRTCPKSRSAIAMLRKSPVSPSVGSISDVVDRVVGGVEARAAIR